MRKEYKISEIKTFSHGVLQQAIAFRVPVVVIIDSKIQQFTVGPYYRGFLYFNDSTRIELLTPDDDIVIIKNNELIEKRDKVYKFN